jgi:hypothetical protein
VSLKIVEDSPFDPAHQHRKRVRGQRLALVALAGLDEERRGHPAAGDDQQVGEVRERHVENQSA